MARNLGWQSFDTAGSGRASTGVERPIAIESPVIAVGDQSFESNRSDVEIAHAARGVLRLERYLPGAQAASVAVKNGWVTLWGEVESDYKRQPATRAVFRLQGVRGITDLIAVRCAATADPASELS